MLRNLLTRVVSKPIPSVRYSNWLFFWFIYGRNRAEGKILEPVGVFEALKQHGKYETGQVRECNYSLVIFLNANILNNLLMFFTSIFNMLSTAFPAQYIWLQGNRVIPLACSPLWSRCEPCCGRQVCATDLVGLFLIKILKCPLHLFVIYLFSKPDTAGHGSKEVKGKMHTYYQVLIDTRDCPHIVSDIKLHIYIYVV